MGTYYKLIDTGINEGEFGIDEMSNKLELTHANNIEGNYFTSGQMTPEAMVKIMLEGLTVCSYWMDTDELKALITDHVDKNIY